MKNQFTMLRLGLVLLLIQTFVVMPFGLHSTAQSVDRNKQRTQNRVKNLVERRGPEVAARVRALRTTDKRTNAALKAFEKKGRAPKIDDAVSIRGTIESPTLTSRATHGDPMFQRVSYLAPQQGTISEGDIELIFITALDLTYEWQGTVIANKYDESGNLLQRYVADLVLTASEYNPQEWTGRYEVMFDENGARWLKHEPGMYTGFSLGTSIQEHQTYFGTLPPFNFESWQFTSSEQEQQYYEMYPQQQEYNRTPGMEQQISRLHGAKLVPAGFRPQRSDRAIERDQLRPCSQTNSCRHNFFSHFPGLAAWGRATGTHCGAFVGGCGIAAVLGIGGYGGCVVRGCAVAAVYNARYLF